MTTLKSFLLLLCIGFSLQAYAQEKVTTREVLSLDKGWSFHKGDIPYPIIKGHNATYRNAKAGYVSGAASPNYDDSSWRIVDIPHDWAIEGRVNPEANLSQGYYAVSAGTAVNSNCLPKIKGSTWNYSSTVLPHMPRSGLTEPYCIATGAVIHPCISTSRRMQHMVTM